MDPSTVVRPLGWTGATAQATIDAALAEQRAQSAQRLAAAIEATGKSYEAIAREADVSTKTISRWVNRRHDPARATVEQVAKALGVDPDWLWPPAKPLDLSALADGDARLDELALQLRRIESLLRYLLTHFDLDAASALQQAEREAEQSRRGAGRRRAAA